MTSPNPSLSVKRDPRSHLIQIFHFPKKKSEMTHPVDQLVDPDFELGTSDSKFKSPVRNDVDN